MSKPMPRPWRLVRISTSRRRGSWLPLMRPGRALDQFPFVAKQVREKVVAPFRRRRGPGDFKTAGDRVCAFARPELVLPAQALFLNDGRFRFRANKCSVAGTVSFSEGVTTGDQRNGFFIVHRHTAESFADISGGCERIRIAVRAFWIHIDQSHLHGSERILKITVPAVAFIGSPSECGCDSAGLSDI